MCLLQSAFVNVSKGKCVTYNAGNKGLPLLNTSNTNVVHTLFTVVGFNPIRVTTQPPLFSSVRHWMGSED